MFNKGMTNSIIKSMYDIIIFPNLTKNLVLRSPSRTHLSHNVWSHMISSWSCNLPRCWLKVSISGIIEAILELHNKLSIYFCLTCTTFGILPNTELFQVANWCPQLVILEARPPISTLVKIYKLDFITSS